MKAVLRVLRRWIVAVLVCAAVATPAHAGETTVAVAANFSAAANELATAFHDVTGHRARYSFGATGLLYTQIAQAAPFDVFLAADQIRPKMAEDAGLSVPGSRFTYAIGHLVLWSADPNRIDGTNAALMHGDFQHLAMANPDTAPYGAAAVEVLNALGLMESLKAKLVVGKSAGQTYQFVATGNAELGFVARSQVGSVESGSVWVIPQALYTPIRQDAVLLRSGAKNAAALAFVDFLKTPDALAIIEKYGYSTGE